jgi:hypothetical protein
MVGIDSIVEDNAGFASGNISFIWEVPSMARDLSILTGVHGFPHFLQIPE